MQAAGLDQEPLARYEWRSMAALAVLFVPTTLFFATYEQQGNTIALWADTYTDRNIDLVVWHGEIPVTWFQMFNPLMIFAFTPVVDRVVVVAGAARRRTFDHHQDGARLLRWWRSPISSWWEPRGSRKGDEASWWWLLAFFVVLTIGELYLSPISLSLVSKVAPARMLSMMMGLWLATSSIGNLMAGWLGSFWSTHGQDQLLPDARRHRRLRGRGDLRVQPAAEGDFGEIDVVCCLAGLVPAIS